MIDKSFSYSIPDFVIPVFIPHVTGVRPCHGNDHEYACDKLWSAGIEDPEVQHEMLSGHNPDKEERFTCLNCGEQVWMSGKELLIGRSNCTWELRHPERVSSCSYFCQNDYVRWVKAHNKNLPDRCAGSDAYWEEFIQRGGPFFTQLWSATGALDRVVATEDCDSEFELGRQFQVFISTLRAIDDLAKLRVVWVRRGLLDKECFKFWIDRFSEGTLTTISIQLEPQALPEGWYRITIRRTPY